MKKDYRQFLAVAVALVLVAASVMAQSAEVEGFLTDPVGAALPGVTVEVLRNGEVIRTEITRADGSFSFPIRFRPQDTVELRLAMAGFTTKIVRLDPDRPRVQASSQFFRLSLEVHSATTAAPPPGPAPPPAPPEPPVLEGPPAPPPPAATPAENHAIVKVFYATDRRPLSSGPLDYGYERNASGMLLLGRFDVSVPRDHRMGSVERPTIWTFWREDPNKHFIIVGRSQKSYQQFYREVSEAVNKSPRKEAFVFVHGYNVEFGSAVYRTAQIAYDLGFAGAPILYSWPSRGTLAGYPVDLNNNDWTVPHLRWFLEDVAAKSGASMIHLIGHSMGNRALVNAIHQIATEQRATPRPRFSQLILTAPDIDAATFENLARAITQTAERLTLYASSNDLALRASKAYQSYQRAGDASPDVTVIEGIDTVDASAVDTSLLGHSYYGDNRSVLSDIFTLVRDGTPPGRRFGIHPRGSAPRLYWAFSP